MRRAAVRRAGVGPRPHTHRGGRHRRALESHGGRRAHTLLPHTPLLPTPLSFPNRPASTRCSHTTPPSHRSLTAPTPPQQRLHTPPRPPRALCSAGRVCRGCGRSCARGEPRCEGPLRAGGTRRGPSLALSCQASFELLLPSHLPPSCEAPALTLRWKLRFIFTLRPRPETEAAQTLDWERRRRLATRHPRHGGRTGRSAVGAADDGPAGAAAQLGSGGRSGHAAARHLASLARGGRPGLTWRSHHLYFEHQSVVVATKIAPVKARASASHPRAECRLCFKWGPEGGGPLAQCSSHRSARLTHDNCSRSSMPWLLRLAGAVLALAVALPVPRLFTK